MGLYLLIPLSVVLVFVIGVIFWWSVRSGQYDDLEGPGFRVLMDDDGHPPREVETLREGTSAEAEAGDGEDQAGRKA
jgi:cbb3-type cytochrome oxidase maturation protein